MQSKPELRFSQCVLLFAALSFGGWAAETVFFYLCYGSLYDRGFLTLPFCTIYGFSLILLYYLIGTPRKKSTFLLSFRSPILQKILYFSFSLLIPTAIELITGICFDRFFDLRLWTYTSYRFHFHGYICLEYSLLWGILTPLCMEWVVIPIKNQICRLSDQCAALFSNSISLLLMVDWGIRFARL